jgi:hypothetical protein
MVDENVTQVILFIESVSPLPQLSLYYFLARPKVLGQVVRIKVYHKKGFCFA